MNQRGKHLVSARAERIAKVKKDAQAKRAELGLEPVPAENAEYEQAMAERKARKRGKG